MTHRHTTSHRHSKFLARVSLLLLIGMLGGPALGYSNEGVFDSNVTIQHPTPSLLMWDTSPPQDEAAWLIQSDGEVIEAFSVGWLDEGLGATPLVIENRTPNNALYVDQSGNIGLGTAAPVQELHIVSGSPAIRFETPDISQTWDLIADTSEFAVYDRTHSSTPFYIDSGAGHGALRIDENGNIGLGTFNPEANLHIHGFATEDVFNGIGPSPSTGPAMNFGYAGHSFGRGAGFFNVRPDNQATGINPALYFATQNLPRMVISKDGKVGISPNATSLRDVFVPSQALDVEGNIRATGSFIANGTTLNVPDYVFADDYELRPLEEVAQFVEDHHHLPDIPSAAEVQAEGLNMTTFQLALLQKIEELTLYTLEQDQTIQAQAEQLHSQDQTIQAQAEQFRAQDQALQALSTRMASWEQRP